MTAPLMPKATAVWLIENTALSFEQISVFTGLHMIEIQAIADDEVSSLKGLNPITNNQLTAEEIKRCEDDSEARLVLTKVVTPDNVLGGKKTRYVAVSKRGDRPDAIAWLLKYYPNIPDSKICELLSTTKPTIKAIKMKTHWNSQNIKPQNPVQLGMCSQAQMDFIISRYGNMQN